MANYHATAANYNQYQQQQHQHHHRHQQHQQQLQYPSVYGHHQQTANMVAGLTTPLTAHHHHHHHHHLQNHPELVYASATASGTLTKLDTLTPNDTSSSSTSSASSSASSAASLQYSLEQATKSTKGASKLRRDLINTEIAQLRELLPLPASTRQRLSQLQLMALVLVYVRKSNYFCNAFRNLNISRELSLVAPTSGFSKALNGFIMMLTQKGKLLYISDNAAEYLGHSMEDLLSHGDEVYDIIEEQDKKIIRTELLSNDDGDQHGVSSASSKSASVSPLGPQQSSQQQQQHSSSVPSSETRIALCRMNVSRNARRQMRFGDQKVVLIEGHYSGYLPLSSRDEPVFVATCTPVAMPETRECVVQGSTHVFTSIHSMDMKFLYIDSVGEHHLNCEKQLIHGKSWYEFIEPDYIQEAQAKHKRITINDQERSTIALLKMTNFDQTAHVWVHSVMQVKEAVDSTTQPVIVCTNQVLSEREAKVMRSNSWLYQFYSLHSKLQCNFSSSSPVDGETDILAEASSDSPQSVCSDSAETAEIGSVVKPAVANLASLKKHSIHQEDSSSLKSKSPLLEVVASPRKRSKQSGGYNTNTVAPSAIKSEALVNGSNTCGAYPSAAESYAQPNAHGAANGPLKTKLSPTSTRSSSSSTSPSFGHSQRSGAANNKSVSYSAHLADFNRGHSTSQQGQPASHYQAYGGSTTGSLCTSSSSSASSTSSVSSSGPTSDMVAAAVNGTAVGLYASAGLADSASVDPLQHMHSSAATHHGHHPAAIYAANQQHAAVNHHHHNAAAAVNYANHVMAAQRSHQAHHHYNPYAQHQGGASHSHFVTQHHPHSQSVVDHHQQMQQQQQATTPYLNHPNQHTAAAAAALYATPAHHQVASAAAAGAFGHHHHHSPHHAAYHSAAVANYHGGMAPVGGPATAGDLPSSYQAGAAAAAAAVAVAHHQGVSFHYNKIAATVNASA